MKRVLAVVLVIGISFALMACGGYTSEEECVLCGETPTKEIKENYYCEECVTTCMFCEEPATEEYTNAYGLECFACKDCYEEMKELQGE